MKSYSDEKQPVLQDLGNGTWYYNFNAKQVEVEEHNEDGELTTRTTWECDQITIKSQTEPTNDDIRKLREEEYKHRSDSLYLAYQKYLALGENEKAATIKQAWLDEVGHIETEYPYLD